MMLAKYLDGAYERTRSIENNLAKLEADLIRLNQERASLLFALRDIAAYTAGDGDTLRRLAALALKDFE